MADAAVVMQPKQAADGGAAVAGDEEIQLTDDGGLSKKILVKGEGSETPEIGDEVTVHYVGTLEDGTEFDSSRGRGDPFKFTLGQGNVIKGWDKGVATFTKGEKSLLKCRSDYAYGDRGSPPKIGPGATLLFEVELLHWKSSKDISNDGGVLKTTLPDQQGDGWERPKPKDEVLVKYEVRVAGSDEVAAASPPEGAEFPLDQAGPLRAFGVALPTMKKGEAAKLLVRPDYGFADAERPAGVPADAGLEATLQLVSWKTYEDVSGDGGVVKKTLSSPGSDWKKPNQGANVKAHLMGRLVDGTVFEDRDLEFVTDEEQVPEGLDLAVQKMKKGEVAEVTLAPRYAFGVDGAQREAGAVPPDATVTYTVTLNDFENAKETWAMSDEEKVAAAAALKEKGNVRFKAGKWAAALAKYKAAAELAEQGKTFEKAAAELQAAAKAVAKGAQLNQVACHARLGDHRQAVTIASKVLESDRTNVKALYRRAQAYLELGEFLEAEADIKRALSEEPNNAGVRALHKLYKQKSKSANQRDKAVFSKMFKPSKAAAPVAGSATAAGIEPVTKEAEAVAAAAQQAGGPELMQVETPVVNGAANSAGQP